MRRKLYFLMRFLIPLTLVVFILNTNQVFAQDDCIWTGAGSDSSWHTAENWECDAHDGVPTAEDSVTIAPAGTVEVLLGDHAEARALVLGIDDDETDAETHNLKTTADNIELIIGDGGVVIPQSGRFDLGQWRTPCCVGARPALRATLQSNGKIVVHGGFYISNTTISSDIVLTRPDAGGSRGRLQARGWNVIHGKVDVIDGFLQPVVPGGFHGDPQPHLRVVDNDILISDSSSVQLYVDSYPLGPPPPDEAPAIAVEGGIFDQRGRVTTSGNPANNIESPIIIDAKVVNSGFITSRLARAQGLSFHGPVDAIHENSGIIEIGGLLSSDTEEDAVDGFGLLIDEGRSLQNSGEILLHRLRIAEGEIKNQDGGIVQDETVVNGAETYTLGFRGSQSVEIDITDPGSIELLTMTWHGEDHPEAGLHEYIEGTGNWWNLSAKTNEDDPASGNFSLSLPRFNDHIPQICRFREDPAGWDCFDTSFNMEKAYITDLNELSGWSVAEYPTITTNDLLDPDFGNDGVVAHELQGRDQAHDVILEPDGSIIVFGESSVMGNDPLTRGGTFIHFDTKGTVIESRLYRAWAWGCGDVPQVFYAGTKLNNGQFITAGYRQVSCGGTPRYFVVIRHNADGTVDQVFDDAVFHNNIAIAHDLTVQPDDKIVVAGRANTSGTDPSSYDVAVARYHPDGSLDENFGDQGEVTFDIYGDFDMIRTVALEEDGKIVIGGFATTGTGRDFLLIRLNTDGSLDMDFGNEGLVLHDFNGFDDMIMDLEIQEDGKIVVAGRTTDSDETTVRFIAARYETDGTPDTGFGDNGVVFVDFGGPAAFAEGLKIDQEGRIYLVGTTESGNGGVDTREVALAVLNPDGSLELEFGDEGKQVFDFGSGPIDVGRALDIDEVLGRIAVAGFTGQRIDGELTIKTGVARLMNNLENGSLTPAVLLLPENNSEKKPEEVIFEWEAVSNAETYQIQVSEEADMNSVFFDSTLSQTMLTFPEPLAESTLYYWRIKAVNEYRESDWSEIWSFTTTMTTSAGLVGDLPVSFELHQNYPNPFNPATNIRYALPADTHVQLAVYDMLGRRMAMLVNERQKAGYHRVYFDGSGFSSGIYFYRITAGNFVKTNRMTLIK